MPLIGEKAPLLPDEHTGARPLGNNETSMPPTPLDRNAAVSRGEVIQFASLTLFPCLWIQLLCPSTTLGELVVMLLLTLSACLWGRVIFVAFGLHESFDRSLPLTYVAGLVFNCLVLFVGKLVIPASITINFLATLVVGLLLYRRIHSIARLWRTPDGEWRDVVVVIWCLLASTLWLGFAMPEKAPVDGGVHTRMFIEYYAHTVNYLPLLGEGTTFSYGSPHFAGEHWSFYHLASYTPAALMARVGHLRASEALVAIWYPLGLVLVGLSASVLAGTAFGRRYALWGTLPVLAPDPTFWSWEALPYSFTRLAEAAPGVSGGITVGALGLTLLVQGTRKKQARCTILGMVVTLACLYFRSSYLFAVVPAAMYVLLFGRGKPDGWSLQMFSLYVALVGAGFLLGKQLSSAPSLELSPRGGEPLAIWVKDLLPKDSFLRVLVPGENASELPVSLARRALFFVMASFQGGLYVWGAVLVASAHVGRTPSALLWFPVASLAVYLSVALLLGPNLNGDPFEIQHRPFGWYYFILATWTGCQIGRLAAHLRLPVDVLAVAMALVLLVPIQQIGQTVRNPFLPEEHKLDRGLLACVDHLRQVTSREERFADSEKDPILVVTALAERPAFVCWRQNYTFPGQGALKDARVKRWEELDQLLASTNREEIESWRTRHGVDWLLVHPQEAPRWPANLLAHPAFEADGYRLYRLSDLPE